MNNYRNEFINNILKNTENSKVTNTVLKLDALSDSISNDV